MWFQAAERNAVNTSLLLNLINNNFLIFFNRESSHFWIPTYPKNLKICDPILVTLLKTRPHYCHSSRENATPSRGTSPIASCKRVPPPPPPGKLASSKSGVRPIIREMGLIKALKWGKEGGEANQRVDYC